MHIHPQVLSADVLWNSFTKSPAIEGLQAGMISIQYSYFMCLRHITLL